MKKPELLVPVGNFEKLEIAIHYGANAVYLSGKDFSLRNSADNFSQAELVNAVDLAHRHNIKVYLACNIYPRNHELSQIRSFLEKVGKIQIDAIIISDPGIIMLAKQIIPHIDIHLSTQANTTNLNAVKFWQIQGIRRVNLARELSLEEIRQIVNQTEIETEIFIHGAMCIAYSGRCLLSSFLTNRDSNRGLCSHPCRWKYVLMEEFRQGEFFPIEEDSRGSYVLNSKDLCMIAHIPELIQSNVTSFKIEGRMKGINYLGSVVKTYRTAIDSYLTSPETYQFNEEWLRELSMNFHRDFCTGFYFGHSKETLPNYNNNYIGEIHNFVGKIISIRSDGQYLVNIRNKIKCGDKVSILTSNGKNRKGQIHALYDSDMTPIDYARPNTQAVIKFDDFFSSNDIIRKICSRDIDE